VALPPNELEAWYEKCKIPDYPVAEKTMVALDPAFDRSWLLPVVTITGATEIERTAAAAHLTRYWLSSTVTIAYPDDLRFYMMGARAAMRRYKSALMRRDPRYDDFDVVMEDCRFLTLTEIGDVAEPDVLDFVSLVRQRRDDKKVTVLTMPDNAEVNEQLLNVSTMGRMIVL
jgi:hypothetical protein